MAVGFVAAVCEVDSPGGSLMADAAAVVSSSASATMASGRTDVELALDFEALDDWELDAVLGQIVFLAEI